MTLLLDTYAILELFSGSKIGLQVKELIENEDEILISSLTIYEAGTFIERKYGKEVSEEYLRSIEDNWSIIDVDREVARSAISLKMEFKLPMADCLIYASARKNNARIVSGCKHFRSISGQNDVIIV